MKAVSAFICQSCCFWKIEPYIQRYYNVFKVFAEVLFHYVEQDKQSTVNIFPYVRIAHKYIVRIDQLGKVCLLVAKKLGHGHW